MELETSKSNTLILTQTDPEIDMVYNAWLAHGLHAGVIFRGGNKIVNALRRLWTDFDLPGYGMWLKGWKHALAKYDTVIVHASERTNRLPRYIHSKHPSMRIIYWYWNPVNEQTLPKPTQDDNVEYWSFDKADCRKYHMHYNVQYYCEGEAAHTANDIKYDVYFIGHDKGRLKVLADIKATLEHQGLQVRYDIVRSPSEYVPYKEVQARLCDAKAILEINQIGQAGMTLRAMEALFFRKKLITNNEKIVSEDFYNENNIFVLGKDNLNNINEFLAKPYDASVDEFRDKHTVDAWFANFFRRQ